MFFKRKVKMPKNYLIDDLKFLTDEAKEAFRVLEITDTSVLLSCEGGTKIRFEKSAISTGIDEQSLVQTNK